VDTPNAFTGNITQPSSDDLSSALGPAGEAWKQLVNWFKSDKHVDGEEWNSSSPKYGWSLRLKLKKRTIVYLGPCVGCFRAGFVLGDRAVAAARLADLPATVLQAINEAPRYAEGTGVRLMISGPEDLPAARILAEIKLAP
jgi:hypothetical protein